MKKIFPIKIKEIETNDLYEILDMQDLKIFIEENLDILEEFEAQTADGNIIKLSRKLLEEKL